MQEKAGGEKQGNDEEMKLKGELVLQSGALSQERTNHFIIRGIAGYGGNAKQRTK